MGLARRQPGERLARQASNTQRRGDHENVLALRIRGNGVCIRRATSAGATGEGLSGRSGDAVVRSERKKVTCVPVPDVTGLQQMDATILNALATEKAARESADQALSARLDGSGVETSIVGMWSVTGAQTCLNSSRGFNADMSPLVTVVPPGQPVIVTVVTQVTGTVNGTRTFRADGTGTAVAVNQNIGFPSLLYGFSPTQIGGIGGATSSTSTGEFVRRIDTDGTLVIEDDRRLVNAFTAPGLRIGTTLVIEDLPPFVGRLQTRIGARSR